LFLGEYQHSIDDKGRIIIPAKFRDALGPDFIITRGLDHCLFIYPRSEWNQLEQRMKSLPSMAANARAFTRLLFSGASECEWDKQGRIHVPAHLREYAKLEKDCTVIGVSTRVEIWDKATWEEYSRQSQDSFNEIAEKLVDFDFNF
jgi:MraZ protein